MVRNWSHSLDLMNTEPLRRPRPDVDDLTSSGITLRCPRGPVVIAAEERLHSENGLHRCATPVRRIEMSASNLRGERYAR